MKRRLVVYSLVSLMCLLSIVGVVNAAKVKVTVWGGGFLDPTIPGGGRNQVEVFNKTHPNIEIVPQAAVQMSGQTLEAVTKLMVAIASGKPPDVAIIDRFMAPTWAVRGMLRPLDDLIKRDKFPLQNFYQACVEESQFGGKTYVISQGTDDRGLYWNKALFKEAGLNPDKPPLTWSQNLEYAIKLTKKDAAGNVIQIGDCPPVTSVTIYGPGNGGLYSYAFMNEGYFMSKDGKKCTLDSPEVVEAVAWLTKFHDALGGVEKVNAFATGTRASVMNPFLEGKIGMIHQGNWFIDHIARYKPDLDFGVTWWPVPDDRYNQVGRFKGLPKFITWSGGWSWGIPTGAKHVKEAWEVIKWLCSPEGFMAYADGEAAYRKTLGVPYVPNMTSNKVADRQILDKYSPLLPKKFADALDFMFSMMPVSRYRPVTPVAAELFDWQMRICDLAFSHQMAPEAAAKLGAQEVQKAIDQYIKEGLLK